MPGSCHNMVKHYNGSASGIMVRIDRHASQLATGCEYVNDCLLRKYLLGVCANANDTIVHGTGLRRVMQNTHDSCRVPRL